jgi:hypothetical protein
MSVDSKESDRDIILDSGFIILSDEDVILADHIDGLEAPLRPADSCVQDEAT